MYTYSMTAITSQPVLSVVEARSKLGQLIKQLADESTTPIYIGSHRKPQAVLLAVGRTPEVEESISQIRLNKVLSFSNFILDLARLLDIKSVGVFGSTVRGEARFDSDLDIAIEPGDKTSLLDVVKFQELLEKLLSLEVHVNTFNPNSRVGEQIAKEIQWLK